MGKDLLFHWNWCFLEPSTSWLNCLDRSGDRFTGKEESSLKKRHRNRWFQMVKAVPACCFHLVFPHRVSVIFGILEIEHSSQPPGLIYVLSFYSFCMCLFRCRDPNLVIIKKPGARSHPMLFGHSDSDLLISAEHRSLQKCLGQ